jgi:hypothetical protein
MNWKHRQTMKESGYEYVRFDAKLGGHVLRDVSSADRHLELWVARKNHASYGIIYKNTHLEFVRSC